jgi:TonB family protein
MRLRRSAFRGGGGEVDIAKDGSVETATSVSGDPQLAPAAIQAVKKWKFRPFTAKGQPLEVETQVTVPFVLPPEQAPAQQPSPDSAQPPPPPQ